MPKQTKRAEGRRWWQRGGKEVVEGETERDIFAEKSANKLEYFAF